MQANKIVFFLIILFCLQRTFSSEAESKGVTEQQPFSLEKFCSSYVGQDDFLKEMAQKVLKNNELRVELVNSMRKQKASGCAAALSNYLNKETKSFDESYLALAFAANLPVATEIIEKEITEGKLLDWLDILNQSDKNSYFKALTQWVNRVASQIRLVDHAETVDGKLYGKVTESGNDIKPPESIPIWNPIIINKYMTEITNQKIKLTKNDFANLNIIFASSNQSYREIFLKQMASVVTLGQTNWILSFREEPSWAQFRLFPIMEKVGGGLMKRELIWLSKYHQNFKIRSVAAIALEKVNITSQPQ